MEKYNNFSLDEAMGMFADPAIDATGGPEQKLSALLSSCQSLEAKENLLDIVFDLVRANIDVKKAVEIGKKSGCRVYG